MWRPRGKPTHNLSQPIIQTTKGSLTALQSLPRANGPMMSIQPEVLKVAKFKALKEREHISVHTTGFLGPRLSITKNMSSQKCFLCGVRYRKAFRRSTGNDWLFSARNSLCKIKTNWPEARIPLAKTLLQRVIVLFRKFVAVAKFNCYFCCEKCSSMYLTKVSRIPQISRCRVTQGGYKSAWIQLFKLPVFGSIRRSEFDINLWRWYWCTGDLSWQQKAPPWASDAFPCGGRKVQSCVYVTEAFLTTPHCNSVSRGAQAENKTSRLVFCVEPYSKD